MIEFAETESWEMEKGYGWKSQEEEEEDERLLMGVYSCKEY